MEERKGFQSIKSVAELRLIYHTRDSKVGELTDSENLRPRLAPARSLSDLPGRLSVSTYSCM